MSSFQVTTPNARLRSLKPGESIEVPYSVANISGGSRRGSFSVKTKDDGTAGWYAIKGAPASDFAPGANQQVTVVVSPPPNAPPKDGYAFHLFVGLSGQEDTDFTDGPEVTYAVAAAEHKTFPWWIVAAAVVLIALVGGVVYFVTRPAGGTVVPSDVIGATPFAVAQEMGGLGVAADRITISCGVDTAAGVTVTSTQPPPGQLLAPNATMSLKLSNCFTIIFPHPIPLSSGLLKNFQPYLKASP